MRRQRRPYANGGPITPQDFSMAALTSINKDLPWVKRALDPRGPKFINKDGSYSTHRLAAETDGKKWYVFPTLDYEDGKWINMTPKDGEFPKEAFDRAISKKIAMEVPDMQTALNYSQNGLINHNKSTFKKY